MITAETAEMLRNGELEFESLSSPLPSGDLTASHIASYAREHHGERAAKLCYGIAKGDAGSSKIADLTSERNRRKLSENFGVDYSQLKRAARNWTPELTPERALDELDGHGGKIAEKSRREWEQRAENETETEGTDNEEFRRKVREQLSGRCGMMADEWLSTMVNLARGCEEHEIDPDDVVMCAKSDAEAGARLRENLTREAGIPEDEARNLSIETLSDLAGDGDDDDSGELTPSPRSGDAQADETATRYEDETKAKQLKQRIEFIENHSSGGDLMETQRDLYEEQLAGLEK